MAVAKTGTKGQRQIHAENLATIRFYAVMTALGSLVHVAVQMIVFAPTTRDWVLFGVSLCIQLSALLCMRLMARASHTDTGALLDAGLDLNMEGGFGESCKDLIILTFAAQVISLVSVYLWSVLLFAPLYALFKLWTTILAPWFFAQSAAGADDQDDKTGKRKQRDAKIKYKRI